MAKENTQGYSKIKLGIIFFCIFLFSFFLQGMRWKEFDIVDRGMWSNEAEYVQNNDPREFDFMLAYGYPAGSIIEGTIVLHQVFSVSYDQALLLIITLLNSIGIASICIMCIILRGNNLWWVAVFGILSLNRLYEYATPPSAVATVFIVLLCLLTLYIYEQKQNIKPIYLGLWGLVAGLFIATRADIGVFSSIIFLFFILKSTDWKKYVFLIGTSFLSFVIFNPFMWFMPLQHIKDLIFKIFYFYAEQTQTSLSFIALLSISLLAVISIILAIFFFFSRKHINPPLPIYFLVNLLIMTFVFYAIILKSHFQAERYFLPIIFIWEVFLPLFVFFLSEKINIVFLKTPNDKSKARKYFQIFFIVLLYSYHLLFLVQAFYINSLYK